MMVSQHHTICVVRATVLVTMPKVFFNKSKPVSGLEKPFPLIFNPGLTQQGLNIPTP
jgi:hypothetical protein